MTAVESCHHLWSPLDVDARGLPVYECVVPGCNARWTEMGVHEAGCPTTDGFDECHCSGGYESEDYSGPDDRDRPNGYWGSDWNPQ